MSDAAKPTEYDEIPYPCGGQEQTHPANLATLAALFGLTPPELSTCRVLELGCGDGSNLIPMAMALPQATFVGIDLSIRQLEMGQREIQQLGIRNLSLRHQNILDFGEGEPPFDYIIGHGIYSWVPAPVRKKILEICSRLLTKNGIAYLSYNTYPGWHLRAPIRDMMRFHTQHISEPKRRVAQGLAMVNFVATAVPQHLQIYRRNVEAELLRLSELPADYVIHDDLGEINQPFYFHEFITAATEHGLQFLSEARFHSMQDNRLSPEARSTLRKSGDMLVIEQYRDFITANSFRQTLLCHADQALDRRLRPETLEQFLVSSTVRSKSPNPDITGDTEEQFHANSVTLSVAEPIAKAALVILQEHTPKALPFNTLFTMSLRRSNTEAAANFDLGFRLHQRRELCDLLLAGLGAGILKLQLFQAAFCLRPAERPKLGDFARLRILERKEVTTPLLENIRFDEPFGRQLALLCDGNRTRQQLIQEMTQRVENGEFPSELPEGPKPDAESLRRMVEGRVAECLDRIARYAVLVDND